MQTNCSSVPEMLESPLWEEHRANGTAARAKRVGRFPIELPTLFINAEVKRDDLAPLWSLAKGELASDARLEDAVWMALAIGAAPLLTYSLTLLIF